MKDKLHLYCGDMDSFYLNLAVYLLQDFLKTTDSGATFEYGRPMKPHGWNPMTITEMVKVMAASMSSQTGGKKSETSFSPRYLPVSGLVQNERF